MTTDAKKVSSIILLAVPAIIWGGCFMLWILTGANIQAHLTGSQPITIFQKEMFRAGHAHAGVLVILSLIAQLFIDQINFPPMFRWILRIGFPFSGVLISLGFFAAATGANITSANQFIFLVYLGATLLAMCVVALGLGLLKKSRTFEIHSDNLS